MSGREWRTIALLLLFGAAGRSWIVADDNGGFFNAAVWTVLLTILVFVPLKVRS